MVQTVINLEGKWRSGIGATATIISLSESSITLKTPFTNEIKGFGVILNSNTISVTFRATGKTVTGKLEQPNRIKWLFPGASDWVKLIDLKGRLEGNWIPEDGHGRDSVVVSMKDSSISMEFYGTDIVIDMSHVNRPNAHGSVIDRNTIRITFPDDTTHDGNVEEFHKIKWSNGSVWVFFVPEE